MLFPHYSWKVSLVYLQLWCIIFHTSSQHQQSTALACSRRPVLRVVSGAPELCSPSPTSPQHLPRTELTSHTNHVCPLTKGTNEPGQEKMKSSKRDASKWPHLQEADRSHAGRSTQCLTDQPLSSHNQFLQPFLLLSSTKSKQLPLLETVTWYFSTTLKVSLWELPERQEAHFLILHQLFSSLLLLLSQYISCSLSAIVLVKIHILDKIEIKSTSIILLYLFIEVFLMKNMCSARLVPCCSSLPFCQRLPQPLLSYLHEQSLPKHLGQRNWVSLDVLNNTFLLTLSDCEDKGAFSQMAQLAQLKMVRRNHLAAVTCSTSTASSASGCLSMASCSGVTSV